ncbi:AraC family transcriptional regulator [Paenibacillus sp. sptzw28]|uniref:AraC family transcriptional regulator n=1 Tax=Paenibacillus sp. sptzw28 TaxID=715179 RepID=UPI001C6DFC5D|nr:AraC family transcriptional regulator [Paenibacillus sp. sptzw28]QYR20579.1 AraC family transcriptional regulator [Paenibacillus sp. sptzw28]
MARPFSYTVVSNPIPNEHGDLYVLFSGESQTKPGHLIGPKVYDFYLMHHVLSGSGTFTCADKQYELQQGQTFLIPPEQLISYASSESDPWRYRWIAFEGRMAAGLAASVGLSDHQPVIDTEKNKRIGVLFHSIERTFRHGGAAAHLRSVGYLHLLFGEFSSTLQPQDGSAQRTGNDGEALIRQIIRYLSTQYAEPVTIERMADSLGYNRAYLSRLFKQRTGLTPVTFLLKLRIDKARLLLRERPELTIEQIAASVGLQDPLYFSKQFRRFYGLPPSAYREEMSSV